MVEPVSAKMAYWQPARGMHEFQVEMAARYCPGFTFDIVKASGMLNGIKPYSAPAELKIGDGARLLIYRAYGALFSFFLIKLRVRQSFADS